MCEENDKVLENSPTDGTWAASKSAIVNNTATNIVSAHILLN